MPLSLAQAHVLIAAAHDHAVANSWKIAVAVVDEGGLLVALGRMDGAFPLSATACWAQPGRAARAATTTAPVSRQAYVPSFHADTTGGSLRDLWGNVVRSLAWAR